MEHTPRNVVLIDVNRQRLKTYINDADDASLLQSCVLDPPGFVRTAEGLFLRRFTGIILFDLADAQKVVYIKSGEVVFARSSINDERLGETLCRMGKLTVGELDRASKEITPQRKLGKILIENGHITSRDLWLGVRRQIFEIWGSYVLRQTHGDSPWFHIIECAIDDSSVVKPTGNMLDSLFEFLRERLGSGDMPAGPAIGEDDTICLNYLTNAVSTFNPIEKAIIKQLLTSNNATVSKLAKDIRVDVPTVRNTVRPLVYAGMLDARKQSHRVEGKTEDVKFEELLTLTNAIMTSIAEIMGKKASHIDFKTNVRNYIKLSDSVFRDCSINENGCFDIDRMISVYKGSRLLSPYDELVAFIKELIQFELFEIKNYLSEDQTSELEDISAALG
ncbi:MAG: hypothetical protein M1491_07940 [Deltaproteobacteria bacterium]|nr:hypothetical protein [Deltaproteobacteria bacterium]MCL5276548.1 hypothetical protein [Deltaproteobacteria bacterium]